MNDNSSTKHAMLCCSICSKYLSNHDKLNGPSMAVFTRYFKVVSCSFLYFLGQKMADKAVSVFGNISEKLFFHIFAIDTRLQ